MSRAFLFVLDSFGIGGADDAARFGDVGSDTFGHIEQACAAGQADRDGLRAGPLKLPNMMSLGLGRAAASAGHVSRHETPLLPSAFYGAAQEVSSGKDTPSGHWEIAALPVPFEWGYFPTTVPTFPADLIQAIVREAQVARHSRRLPCIGHRDHRKARRGAYPHRQADLLHIRRLGDPDRGARDAFRPGAALRALLDGAKACRSAEHRPRHRPAVRRRKRSDLRAHRQPARLCRSAARSRRCSTASWRAARRSSASARSATSSRIAASPRCARRPATWRCSTRRWAR